MNIIVDVIKKYALEFGDFTLKSGQKSNYYLDCRKLTISSNITYIVHAFNEFLDQNNVVWDAVAGPSLGACPIVTGISMLHKDIRAGYVRSEVKDHGKKDMVIGSVQARDRVVLVEDVTTSGQSLLNAAIELQKMGCYTIQAITLVDRLQGASELFQKNNIPFGAITTIQDLGLE
jgi:orotate phosphoribosyltransferase